MTNETDSSEVGSHDALSGDAPMVTAAEKRAYSRGYSAGRKSSRNASVMHGSPMADLEQLVAITRARCARLEEELAQARASRDLARTKYHQVSEWIKAHIRIAADGTVLPLPRKVQ